MATIRWREVPCPALPNPALCATSATWRGRRSVKWPICCRRETPVTTIRCPGLPRHRREEPLGADLLGNVVVLLLEPERAGHAAAAGVELRDRAVGISLRAASSGRYRCAPSGDSGRAAGGRSPGRRSSLGFALPEVHASARNSSSMFRRWRRLVHGVALRPGRDSVAQRAAGSSARSRPRASSFGVGKQLAHVATRLPREPAPSSPFEIAGRWQQGFSARITSNPEASSTDTAARPTSG